MVMGTHGRGGVKHWVLGSVAEKMVTGIEGAGDHGASSSSPGMSPRSSTHSNVRIVLTGGPGGGKTTALDLFRRELRERVVAVPESATIMFTGGFPRVDEPEARRFGADRHLSRAEKPGGRAERAAPEARPAL